MAHQESSRFLGVFLELCGVFPHFCMTLVQFVVIRWCFFDGILPHYKLFETQAQFIVVTEELRVCWDLIQEDLGHLQWALQQWGGWAERGGKGQKQRRIVRETKKERAKTERRKEREDVREEVFESV